MRVSLVLATIARVDTLRRLFSSLEHQAVPLQLIIVDQNSDDRLTSLIHSWSNRFHIEHIRSLPGLSRARNRGLAFADGDVVGFPDDDCWYADGFLPKITSAFAGNPDVAGITCQVRDERGRSAARWSASSGFVTPSTAWTRMSSASMFFRRSALAELGAFDESLGVGAGTRWGGAEDLDYVLRAVMRKYRILYLPHLAVLHPYTSTTPDAAGIARARAYGAGTGRAWRNNAVPAWLVAYYLARPAAGFLLSLCRLRLGAARVHAAAFQGRVAGWL